MDIRFHIVPRTPISITCEHAAVGIDIGGDEINPHVGKYIKSLTKKDSLPIMKLSDPDELEITCEYGKRITKKQMKQVSLSFDVINASLETITATISVDPQIDGSLKITQRNGVLVA